MKLRIILPIMLLAFLVSCKNKHQEKEDECCKKDKSTDSIMAVDTSISLHDIQAEWTTQDGKQVKLSDFHKKATIVAMIFTNCQSACPRITADIQRIENEIPADKRKEVDFVLISMDPERDTPEQLKKFATEHKLDYTNWTLLTGKQSDVDDLAGVLNVRISKQPDGSFDHSNIIHLLNPNGNIVHQQIGLAVDPKETIQLINVLLK